MAIGSKMYAKRYIGHLRVDSTFNNNNLPLENMKSLNYKISKAVKEWSIEMKDKGLSVDVVLDWSEASGELDGIRI